jgi:hypothetical protein
MQFPIHFVSSGFRFAQVAVPDFAPTKVRGKPRGIMLFARFNVFEFLLIQRGKLSSSGFRFAQDAVKVKK